MLSPFLSDLLQRRIVLGSSSPRRLGIFKEQLGLTNVAVTPSTFEENLDKRLYSPIDYVQSTCLGKTYELLSRTPALLHTDLDILVCADTIIEHEGLILEKPNDGTAAVEMLKSLSGKEHYVHTCVSISTINLTINFTETTTVTFDEMTEKSIRCYVETGESFDKAGGYGYQSGAASFVRSITGCYYNVVGFPVNRFARELVALLEMEVRSVDENSHS
jgi:septum formation protein